MEYISLILILVCLVFWKLFISQHKIELSSPIFRNTETKELGCWATRTLKMPFPPFAGLVIHDGSGAICKIREVSWDKGYPSIVTCHTYCEQHICTDDEQYEHMKQSLKEFGWKLRQVEEGKILNWWKEEYEN